MLKFSCEKTLVDVRRWPVFARRYVCRYLLGKTIRPSPNFALFLSPVGPAAEGEEASYNVHYVDLSIFCTAFYRRVTPPYHSHSVPAPHAELLLLEPKNMVP